MADFAQGFRLTADGETYDGAQFPSGRVVVDHPTDGLTTAAASIDALLAGMPGDITWAPGADAPPTPVIDDPDRPVKPAPIVTPPEEQTP